MQRGVGRPWPVTEPLMDPFRPAQQTKSRSRVRMLARANAGSVVAAVTTVESLLVWNSLSNRKVAELPFHFIADPDCFAVSKDGRCCFGCLESCHSWETAKAPGSGWVICLDLVTGKPIWERRDLNGERSVTLSSLGDRVFCGSSSGAEIVATADGQRLGTVKGARKIVVSRFSNRMLVLKAVPELVTTDLEPVARLPRCKSPELLNAVFGKLSVLVAEPGKSLRCFSTDSGRLLWESAPMHVREIVYSRARNCFYGHQFDESAAESARLIRWDSRTGKETEVCKLKTDGWVFIRDASRVLATDGTCIDCQSGQKLKRLSFPKEPNPVFKPADAKSSFDRLGAWLRDNPWAQAN